MNDHIHQIHLARKRYGQNFLHDSLIINTIISTINPMPNQAIVEIGPGLGALTKPMAECINNMTVIEIDRDLVRYLSNHPFLKSKINILEQDAMKVNFLSLSIEKKQHLRIFGNLPYNISTPLIFHLFKHIHVVHDMHFMLQKEIVNRLAASPNSKIYGRLSVIAQYYCRITPILKVPPTSFWPIPKVDSAIVQLLPYSTPPFPVFELINLITLTNLAFSQRRKTLRNSLSNLFSVQQLAQQNIDATLRAENLSVEDYCRLANALPKNYFFTRP